MCDKSKYECRGFGTVFDDASSRKFDNDFPRNVALFGVDNSSLSHADNCKNNFLVLVEGPTDEINDSIGAAEKTFSIKTKFRLSFAIVIIVVILFIGTKSNLKKSKSRKSSLKQITKMSTFQANFAQEAYLKSWMLFNLKQNLLEEVCIIFQLITMLLINLTY